VGVEIWWTESPLDGLAHDRILFGICAQQAQIAGEHHVAMWHGEVRAEAGLDEQLAPRAGDGQ
jgi:hypothetical protein